MYESFYKLQPNPFRLTPDPRFFFESETHKRGLAYLQFAFYQREGFVVITGAPGTGKTELSLNLIEGLPQSKVSLAKIVTTNLDADDLLDLVAASFKIDPDHISKGTELKKLEEFFISQARIGKQVLLIIDEAHNLSVKSLLELSMLENFQLNEKPVMQCFLIGQQSLEEKLNLPELEPLKQRVIASARLENMSRQETREYIIHRLSQSGWDNNPIILDEAFLLIHHYTHGIPRKINSLCNRLLLHSYVENIHNIDASSVHEVIQEFQEESVNETLDLDFADLQIDIKPAAESRHKNTDQSQNFSKQKQTQQSAASRYDKPAEYKSTAKSNTPIETIVPAFLKNTKEQYLQDKPSILENNRESNTFDAKRQNVGLRVNEQHLTKQKNGIVQGDADVAAVRQAADQPVNRSSGLLDKELQFLLSAAATQPVKYADQTNQTPQPESIPEPEQAPIAEVEQEPQQEANTIRKVIIDESVYEQEELSDPDLEEDWLEPKTVTPAADNWRYITMAILVTASLIMSVMWLYDGTPESAMLVAENNLEVENKNENLAEPVVVATETPAQIELPVISSPDSHTETLNEIDTEVSDIPEASEVNTSIAAISTAPPTTAAISDSDTTGTNDKPETSELDIQLTQILEKSGPEDIKPVNIVGNNTRPTPESGNESNQDTKGPSELAVVSNNGQHVKPKLVKTKPDKKIIKNQNSATSITKRNTSPKADKKTAASKIDSASIATLIKSMPDLPSNNSALNKPTAQHLPNETELDQRSANTDTSSTTLSSNQQTNSHSSESAVSPADLTTLLSRLSKAYETGNLQQLVTTFAPDINSNDGSNRQQMLKEYQRLFNITDKRQLTIQDVKWSTKDRQILGMGDFEVLIREKGATKYTTYQGKIHFAVAKEANSVVIKKLDYDYGQ